MTVLVMCSVRDVVASTFGRPFFVPSNPVAVRSFGDEINNPQSGMLNSHPGDFELYCLGSFDDDDASVSMLPQPQLLVRAADLVKGSPDRVA